jgi:hypothetical protein
MVRSARYRAANFFLASQGAAGRENVFAAGVATNHRLANVAGKRIAEGT